jgi:hypothetical protein
MLTTGTPQPQPIIPRASITTTPRAQPLISTGMDFMERLALFLNSFLAFLFFSCSQEKQAQHFANRDSVAVKQAMGVLYVNDSVFTGTLFSLHPQTKDTLELSSFLNGREHGTWKRFYSKGTMKEIRQFDNGKKQGDYLGWWENGSKKFAFRFKDDEYNGTSYEWAEDGQLYHEANYIMGHEEGAQRVWYANGKIKSNYTIINGRRYGLLGTKNCKNVSDSVFVR